ncbi:uncharacterized protein si:dkey-1h6.8 isoform X2 [Xiphias gladius]|nr:uncharacterized protein si:dkey-1h6.8 isoform X2 [Xiphias gladius]XP_039980497.1 uncharacterized protein si:dkey-1h6.8 isoform X2 [Xiphias gladius]
MATADGEDIKRGEKVGLKRKLTGPPRLLLGKTRTRSIGEDRAEAWTKRDRDKTSQKNSAAAAENETAELTESPNMEEEVLSDVNVEGCRGRCEDTGEDDDIRNRKVSRRRWWRRFSSAPLCIRRQNSNVEESSEKQPHHQEADAGEENSKSVSKARKRFNLRFRTSSNVHTHEQRKDADEPSLTFQKKLRKFFTKGGRSRSSGLAAENMEDMMRIEEATRLPDELMSDGTDRSPEAVTVTAEMDVELTEDRVTAESPEESPVEVTKKDLTADGSETIQIDSEVVQVAEDTDEVPVEDLIEIESPERDEVFSPEVLLDLDDHLSVWTVSSEEKMDQTTSQSLHPTTNGPSIRIELVPPDDVTLEDAEEEECWVGSSSSENQSHLLLLLGCDHGERQLLQTARSLVRAAMNAAVDQLTREQQSGSDCVHREPQGCRDHA